MSPIKIRGLISKTLFKYKVQKLFEGYMYLLLLIPLFLIVYPLIGPGIVITGDFPFSDTPDYAIDRLWLWIQKGSIDGFEFVPRFPIIGLNSLLSIIGINSELVSKAMVVSGFLLSSFSFYFSFLLLFKDRFIHSEVRLKLAAVLGSLFYAYNVWSFNRIHHWYLWIGYSLLPLFLISIFFSFRSYKNWKSILSSIFLWSIASTTPHMALFYGIILIVTFLIFIFNNLYKKRKLTMQLVIPLLLIISFYSLVNMYWIYPYILASRTQVLTPNYELTQENLELLSREGNFLNSFRVLVHWLNPDVEISDNLLLYYFSIITSIVIPIIAFSALFLKKSSKFSLIFSVCALIGIMLVMGTQSPIDYYYLLLSVPTLSGLTWIFRDPDKWSFLISLAYAFLLGIVSYYVFSLVPKQKNMDRKKLVITICFSIVLIGSIFVSSYPFYKARMEPLKPVVLPKEFDRLNEYLSTISTDKVYFMPYPAQQTQWKMDGRVGSIYQAHSTKPSIESTEYNYNARNYYIFLVNSIMENRSKNISNFISPLGTSYIIFHNDSWSKGRDSYDPRNIDLLKKLYLLDLKNISNIGFYKIFKTSNDDKNYHARQVNIPSQNIAILGGLNTINSLNTISSFNTLHSSTFFLDDISTKNTKVSKSFDELILDRFSSSVEFLPYFVDDKYIIAPSDATMRHEPGEVWSKSGARDPINAVFHPHLKNLGIDNWDLDFGKGLVMTKAMGSKLSIPLEIGNQNDSINSNDNNFYLFMRYLKNQKGGPMKIYIDNTLIKEVDTFDKLANSFVWKSIGSINLTQGRHTITLENVAGLNAINIFALIPHSKMNSLTADTDYLLASKTRLIYLLEAESNFYSDKGKDTGSFHNLLEYNSNVSSDNPKNSFTKTFRGQFKVPENSDLVALQFLAKKSSNSKSSYSIRDLGVTPAYERYNVIKLDFEREKGSAPLATLRHSDLFNYDKDIVSTSLESNSPIYGNNSLRVDLKPSNKSGSNILSTDYIPISEEAYYNASLDISAKDVKQLHSRILYYDSNKKEITKARDFVFRGKDGTFQDTFTSSILPPKDSKYLKYQVLTMSSNVKPSTYLFDNVKLDEIIPTRLTFKDNFASFKNLNSETQDMMILNNNTFTDANSDHDGGQSLLTVQPENGNSAGFYKIETESFPVEENRVYDFTMTVKAENLSSLYGIASFKSSDDVVENSTRYGNNASNGRVLSLSPGSEANTRLDIIKPSNYTIAIRANTCVTCTFVNVSIEGPDNGRDNYKKNLQSYSINLKDKKSGLKWLYSNSTHLDKGTYDLKIYSNSQADLDSVIVYQNSNTSVSDFNSKNPNETLEDIFDSRILPPPTISEYKKINPTKYIVDIYNATRPYIVSLAEAYDPLWLAYVDNKGENNNFKINSFPLYGVVNGFYVNKTGNYTLVIEYQPQDWFIQGLTISIFTLALIVAITLFFYKKVGLDKSYTLVKRIRKYIGYEKRA